MDNTTATPNGAKKTSPKKLTTQQDFKAASHAVELEYDAVKRLKRLSIGNSLIFDPDLPLPENYYLENSEINININADTRQNKTHLDSNLQRSKSKLSTHSLTRSLHSGDENIENGKRVSIEKGDEDDYSYHDDSFDEDDDNHTFYDSLDDIETEKEGKKKGKKIESDNNRPLLASKENAGTGDDEDEDFIDIDPDSSFGDSDLLWVPATAHPKISPEKFKEHIKTAVSENKRGQIKKSTAISSSNSEYSESNNDDNKNEKRDGNTSNAKEDIQLRQPSLRELTVQLETLSKRAGLDDDDAITLARSLSTRSIGMTKLEKEVYQQNDNEDLSDEQSKEKNLSRAKSRKVLLRNKLNKTRESLFIKDDTLDDVIDSNIENDLVQMEQSNMSSPVDFVSTLKQNSWSNYRRQQYRDPNNNRITPSPRQNLPSLPQRLHVNKNNNNSAHAHVYNDIKKIHNAQKPLGKPQLEPLILKTPSSRLPEIPSPNKTSPSANSLTSPPTTPTNASSPSLVNPSISNNAGPSHENLNSRQDNQYYQKQFPQKNQLRRGNIHQTPSRQQQFSSQQPQQRLPKQRINIQPHNHQQQRLHKQQQQNPQNQLRAVNYQNISHKDRPLPQSPYHPKNGQHDQQIQLPTNLQDQRKVGQPQQNQRNAYSNNVGSSANRYLNNEREIRLKTNNKHVIPDRSVPNQLNKHEHLPLAEKSNELNLPAYRSNENHEGGNKTSNSIQPLKVNTNILIEKSDVPDTTAETEKEMNIDSEKENELESKKEKEKMKEGKLKSKSSFSSFFKIKRDKPRNSSATITEQVDEPKITFKVKRSHSHSSESGMSSPKADFKAFFGGKKEKEKGKEKEQEKDREKEREKAIDKKNNGRSDHTEREQIISNEKISLKEKEKEFSGTIVSIGKMAHDGLSSSPKLGISLFSHHDKNKSSENLAERKEKIDARKTSTSYNSDTKSEALDSNDNVKSNDTTLGKNANTSSDASKTTSFLYKSRSIESPSPVITPALSTPSSSDSSNPSPISSGGTDPVETVDRVELPVQERKSADNNTEVIPLAKNSNDQPNEQTAETDSTELIKKSLKQTLQQNERPSKPNQPLEMKDSAFGFPLPPVSNSTLVMLDHRFPVHVERAIYRLSHLKLADPKRPLKQQVLLSNFMYSYLNLVNHTLWIQSKEQEIKGNENSISNVGTSNAGLMITDGANSTSM